MKQFRVPNRLKGIKKTISGLIGSFNIKKIEIYLRALFFNKTFLLSFAFSSPLEKSLFHIEVPLMTSLFYSQMKPN